MKTDKNYVNLKGFIGGLGVDEILIDREIQNSLNIDDFKDISLSYLTILESMIHEMGEEIPFRFSAVINGILLSLRADYKIIEKLIVIDFDGEA